MIALYVRVSSEEQARKGTSIDDQLRDCRIKAGNEEYKEYIDDGFSGEYLERPGLEKLRQDVREGIISKVIVYDPDRWSRNLMNQLLVTDEIEKRAELVFVNGEYAKTPEGRLFYQMRGAISEFEKAKITERMSRGRRAVARKGKVLRDYNIYGYDFDDENRSLVINEYEAAVVQLMFDLCTKPHIVNNEDMRVEGFNGIAKYLMNKGIPAKSGGTVWHRQVIRQILNNSVYIGEFYQNKWDTEGMLGNRHKEPGEKIPMKLKPKEEWILTPCPSIIDRQQFEHVQNILEESKRRWTKATRHKYLLSGIIRCGECGNTMSGVKSVNWGKEVFIYTCVKNTAGAKNKGCGRRPQCHVIDKKVWKKIHSWLSSPDEVNSAVEHKKTSTFEEAEFDRVNKEIEKAKNARKRLLRLFAGEGGEEIGEEEIKQELAEWKDKENNLRARLEELKLRMELNQKNEYNKNIMQDAIEYYLTKKTEELTFEDKQYLIRLIVREVRSFNKSIEIYSF